MRPLFPIVATLLATALCVSCGGKKKNQGDGDEDADVADVVEDDAEDEADAPVDADEEEVVEPGPGPEFDELCGADEWDSHLVPATVNELGGTFSGTYSGQPLGTLEITKVIPEHPFHVRTIRVAFGAGAGTARIRLMRSWGRSYPDVYADPPGDLIEPVDLSVMGPTSERWFEIDVSEEEVYLLPTEHYTIVNEYVESTYPIPPAVAVEELLDGDFSRALMIVPTSATPYGVDGNFRMELVGDYFCLMEEGDRWFSEDTDQPWSDVSSSRASASDLNGDGHDDLVFIAEAPYTYFGDGDGNFAAPGFDPFPDAHSATSLHFGDLDNDGDVDAFSMTNVSPDADGDRVTKSEGDCNDGDASIRPGATEVADNGLDEDCDTVADDGTDTSDRDSDGVTVAAGDCDDTRDTTYPGATEALDNRDNDCDGQTDEDFVNRILINDGTGLFSAISCPAVEKLDPSATGSFGDGNGDGVLDIYWGNWLEHYPDPTAVTDYYVLGAGDGTFTDATAAAGMDLSAPRACYGVIWTDYNNDGLMDIYVGNYGYGLNLMWRNNGDGTFTNTGDDIGLAEDDIGFRGGNTFGGDFGDVDNDGDMDNYSANIAHPRYQPSSDISTFNINQGPSDFTYLNLRVEYGFVYDEGDVNATFADFDNDMDLDIAVASLYTGHFSRLYRNDGADGFTDVTYQANVAVNDAVSVIWTDVDEDGDLDLIVSDRWRLPMVHLFINLVGQDRNWIELDLEGTTTNRDALGARVTLTAGGVTQVREVKNAGGHNTQTTRIVHFGLGDVTTIDSVTVHWIGGSTETITGLAPNGLYRVVEGSGTGVLIP